MRIARLSEAATAESRRAEGGRTAAPGLQSCSLARHGADSFHMRTCMLSLPPPPAARALLVQRDFGGALLEAAQPAGRAQPPRDQGIQRSLCHTVARGVSHMQEQGRLGESSNTHQLLELQRARPPRRRRPCRSQSRIVSASAPLTAGSHKTGTKTYTSGPVRQQHGIFRCGRPPYDRPARWLRACA